jgi:predicted O-methyltransferase YrrM
MLLAMMCRARSILEIGTLGGYSTIWLARALPADGHPITLEADDHHADVAKRNITMAGFADQVTVLLGPALQSLPKLQAEQAGPFDLIFIDADKVSYPQYLRWALRLARPGTAIIVDNVVRDGKVIDPDSGDPSVDGARSMLELAARTSVLETTVLQTVGSKGWDGWAINVVTAAAADSGTTQPG